MQLDPGFVADIRGWLRKASIDAHTCRALIFSGFSNLETPIGYHLQQTIEKLMKGFILFNEVEFAKTHYLDDLRELCINLNPELTNALESIELLTPFAVEFRYPASETEEIEVTMEEIRDLVHMTERGIRAVMPLFPNEFATGMELLTDPIIPTTE